MDAILSSLLQAGLIDADTADILRRQNSIDDARLWAEGEMTTAVSGGLSAQQQRLLTMLRDSDYKPTAKALSSFWAAEDDLLWRALKPTVLQVVTERATLAAVMGGQVDTFRMINENVIRWAETRYIDPSGATFGSVPNLNLTSRQQVATAFTAWNRGELPGTPRGLPSLIEALTPTFGAVRADRIGVTEVSRLFIEAQRAAEADNKFTVGFIWQSAADDRQCPVCGPRNGEFRLKADLYSGGVDIPAHVKCRCNESPATEATRRIPLSAPVTAPVEPAVPSVVTAPTATVAPLNRYTIEADGPLAQLHLAHYNRIPIELRNAVESQGVSVFINNDKSMPDIDDLGQYKGVAPRGWPAGMTWDGVPGVYDFTRKNVVAGSGAHGSSSVLLHEYGHALGYELGYNDDARLKAAHAEVFNGLISYLQQGGPGGEVGRQELLAESFAQTLLDRPKAVTLYSQGVVDFIENIVLKGLPAQP